MVSKFLLVIYISSKIYWNSNCKIKFPNKNNTYWRSNKSVYKLELFVYFALNILSKLVENSVFDNWNLIGFQNDKSSYKLIISNDLRLWSCGPTQAFRCSFLDRDRLLAWKFWAKKNPDSIVRVVVPHRLELWTHRLWVCCSNQLSYRTGLHWSNG